MKARATTSFMSIRTEGSILPADLLQRIAEGTGLEGLTPQDYHLPEGEKLNEAINRSWLRVLSYWRTFRSHLGKLPPEDQTATSLTRERWLLPLFQELGYGRLPAQRRSFEMDGEEFPISHLWGSTPIHLVGARLEIDRVARGIPGAARAAPHSMVQDFLNRSDEHLWAFVSNGLRLRILRDNLSLVRQAYVEFDLEAMMEGEFYPDFAILWLLCHQSRVEAERPEECWLEQWSRKASEEGVRALEQLRSGVEEAIAALGRGFLAGRGNTRLLERLRDGSLDKQDYYRQLLRLVYRLVFLFVAEDRDLLFAPDADPAARKRYADYFSTRRLREIARKVRGGSHPDLWDGLKLLMRGLGSDEGLSELGLPALGSYLWSDDACPDLMDAVLPNRELLEAIRALSVITVGGKRRVVSYKNLRSEELGSIYEALLELHPVLNPQAAAFSLEVIAGHERKLTGSYYTPESLVQSLIETALEPVIEERLKSAREKAEKEKSGAEEDGSYARIAEEELLSIKVCDPACGSGHFLVAAAHRLARHLARVRSGSVEPPPDVVQRALRDVIGHCVYGVDINPMSVELCKFALWMEAMEPGKPLSFLDHHIRVGNSLLGATPDLIAAGLPDETYTPVEGDDREACAALKRINRVQRDALRHLFVAEDNAIRERLRQASAALDEMDDSKPETIRVKEAAFRSAESNYDFLKARTLANLWCAAFVIRKRFAENARITSAIASPAVEAVSASTPLQLGLFGGTEVAPKIKTKRDRPLRHSPIDKPIGITTQHLRDFIEGGVLPEGLLDEVQRLTVHYRFFHWHLAFPEVFQPLETIALDNSIGRINGFDCILGNPPWVSYTGRQQVKVSQGTLRLLIARFPCVARWPASHPAFLVLSVQTLAKHGRAGLVLPKQVADLSAYSQARAEVTSIAKLTAPIVDIGEDTFPGVTQPVGLFSIVTDNNLNRRSDAAWPLAKASSNKNTEDSTIDVIYSAHTGLPNLTALFTDRPRFAPKTFADPGVHTGNVSRKIIVDQAEPDGMGYIPIRQGRDIAAFICSPPKKWLWTMPSLVGNEYCRIRKLELYRNVPILIRQTANRPIAARHREPTYFRNSILACMGVPGISDNIVVAFLNSALYAILHRKYAQDANQKAFPQVKIRHLRALPTIPIEALNRPYEGHTLYEALEASAHKAEVAAQLGVPLPLEVLEQIERLVLTTFDLSADLAPKLLEVAK